MWTCYISLLVKHLIMYWWKTWASRYRGSIIITPVKIFLSILFARLHQWKYFCQFCLHGFTSEEVLKNYLERCKLHGMQTIKVSESDDKKGRDKIKFTITEYQLHLPFVIYADFETVLHKMLWAIILHHPTTASRTMWVLHLREMQWWAILWTTPSEYGRWCCWKVFEPSHRRSNHL